MDYLGLLCLGGSIGALAAFGLQFVTRVETWQQMLTTVIAAALAGTVLLFIDRFRSTKALGSYCVDLLLALMWAYANVAIANVKSPDPSIQLLGWLDIGATTLVSIVAAALVPPPAFRDAWARPQQGL